VFGVRKILSFVLVIALLFSLAACGSNAPAAVEPESVPVESTTETEPPFDIEECKQKYNIKISNWLSQIEAEAEFLSSIADYQIALWEANAQFSRDVSGEDLADSTWEMLSEKGWKKGDLEAKYKRVVDRYKEILAIDSGDFDSSDILEEVDECMDAYIKLYNMVTEPSGTYESFIEEKDSCLKTIGNCKSKLEILLS
jgi:predicted small lipoprotein YifL